MQDNARVEFANSLRGLAAVAVLISHYFGLFWTHPDVIAGLINSPVLFVGQSGVPAYVWWLNAVPIFNWGAYGVALFFLISGFVIPFSLTGARAGAFCISRVLRIVPAYAVGFSICLLALWICTVYFAVPWPYRAGDILVHYFPGMRDILSSPSIDGIIWTLEIEIKFYILCAIFIGWFRGGSLKVFVIPIALFALLAWLNQHVSAWSNSAPTAFRHSMTIIFCSQYIIFMFVGVALHYLHKRRISALNAGFAIIGLFGLFCLQWWMGPHSASFNIALSYGCALATFVLAYAYPRFFRANPVFDFLADISYPLYVIHGVAGYVALRLLLDQGCKAWLALTLVTSGVLLAAWLLHRLIEKPSQTLGRRLARRIETQAPMIMRWPARHRAAVADSAAL